MKKPIPLLPVLKLPRLSDLLEGYGQIDNAGRERLTRLAVELRKLERVGK